MTLRLLCLLAALVLGFAAPVRAESLKPVPESLYPELEYLLTVPQGSADLAPDKLNAIVSFVAATPQGVSMSMRDRDKAAGAFHSFSLRGNLARVVDYAYNPDIPVYVTMPSSVRDQEWLDPATRDDLKSLSRAVEQGGSFQLRGREREIITPDANTGGYYAYRQDRAMAVFPGPTGPVLVSVACQNEPSDIGRKGLVVGPDSDWNYLYSAETGLTKTGLGWVDSYMYQAYSVLVLVSDTEAGVVRVGSFKWLNAGWAKVNMVKQMHIVNGIKRFAADFKAVLESPRLPQAGELAAMYRDLQGDSPENLRAQVAPYLDAIAAGGSSSSLAGPFKKLLTSGEYLRDMSREEMVKIVLKEFLKQRLGRQTLIQVARAGATGTAHP
ncbi:MAG TPA: hypothetical protein DGF30_06955 [Desulfomicrobium sp.]|nr:hypothetical protein [Desulfomicrobium sp.]